MKTRLLSIFAVVAILFLNACKDDEKKLPSNVIQDSDGVKIELRWNTGDSDAQAIEDADLDLYILDGSNLIGESVSGSSFEEIVLNDDYDDDDDEYTITAYLFENFAAVDIDFVITVTGGDKDFEAEGTFLSTDSSGSGVAVFTITKKGNKYTVEED